MSTENLTKEERLGLNDGAVIEWQRADGTWQLGTVDYAAKDGWTWLYDKTGIGPKAPMRLVSAMPAIPTDCDVRGINNEGVRFPPAPAAKPAELPSDLALDEAADAEVQEAPQPPKRNRRGDNKRQNAERWLHAVIAVQEAMYAGRDRTAAVCGVADLPEFSSIRLNVDTFCWWRRRFVLEGKLPKPRKTMPRLAKRPKDEAADSLARRRVGAAMEETIKALQAELAAEREDLKSAVDNLTREQAERDAAVKRADQAEEKLKDAMASNEHIRGLHAKARAELAALLASRAPSSARVSLTIEATPAEAAAILAAIGGR